MNVTVPSGVAAGNVYLDISGPDSYNSEVVVPVAAAGAATVAPQSVQRSIGRRTAPQSRRRIVR
jgi:hypothetical protein